MNNTLRRLAKITICTAFAWVAQPSLTRAEPPPLVIVPVVTDSSDQPRVLELARTLQSTLAKHQLLTVAARFANDLGAAQQGGDSFAQALEMTDGFAVLRYEHYSDEVVRDHARRLAELVNAPHALIVAAPIANRFLVRRVSRGDGESVTLPDPYETSTVDAALLRLVPFAAPSDAASPPPRQEHDTGSTRLWAPASLGLLGIGAGATAGVYAVKRARLSSTFAATAVDDPHYLSTGDDWNALRAPMLWTAGIGSASGSLAAVLFASALPPKHTLASTLPALTVGLAAITWAAIDLAKGSPCSSNPGIAANCTGNETRFDRGLLVALAAAPFLSFSSAQLARWLRVQRFTMGVDASHQAASLRLNAAQ